MRNFGIHARNSDLFAVATLDRETAVSSIVAAEMAESTPSEALKAQAVVARSFLAADARHSDFDFCDTTHCQFIMERHVNGAGVQFQAAISVSRATARAGASKDEASDTALECASMAPPEWPRRALAFVRSFRITIQILRWQPTSASPAPIKCRFWFELKFPQCSSAYRPM
jgi:hypothetical protein